MIRSLTRLLVLGLIAGLPSGWVSTTLAVPTKSTWFARVWQTDDGLPNNIVTAIAQTRDGCLWVGTPAGLVRFDGIHFTEFPYLGSGDSGDPSVHYLWPDPSGGLWVAPSRKPVVCLNPDFSRAALPENNLPDSSQPPYFVTGDNQGSVWVGYANGVICQIKNGTVKQFTSADGVPAGSIGSLVSDNEGNMWLAKAGHLGILKNGRFHTVANFKSAPHLAPARTNGIWVAAGKQLLKYDTHGKVQDFGMYQSEPSTATSRELIEDRIGAVWIGTDGDGLFRYSESGFEKIEASYAYISALAEDSEGNIWAGTLGGGLNRISPGGVQLEKVNEGSSPEPIQSICEGANEVFWGATQNGSLVSRVDGIWGPALANLNLPKSVTCVAVDHTGELWIGMRNSKSLYSWQSNQLTAWDDKNGFVGFNVLALLPASNGDLWVGINQHHSMPPMVQCLHEGHFRILTLPKDAERVMTMAEDAVGNIWAGTAAGQLLRAEGSQFIDETGLTTVSDRAIRCLYVAPDGALWIGYAGWGLGRLKDKHFAQITTDQGLPEDYISQIVADDKGWFWFGGDHSIFKVRQRALEHAMAGGAEDVIPICYGRNEGLFNLQVNYGFWPGGIRSHDGRVWIPTRNAAVVADPSQLLDNPPPPPVLLTRAAVDDRIVAAYGGIEETQSVANLNTRQTPLRLSPYHHNLKFEFTAFSFGAPENVHFRYRLDGLDSQWADANTRSASYSRLAAGKYEFRVEAANGDGLWNEASLPLAIIVNPFFWQTWWFRIGLLALFALCVVAVVRYVSFRRLHRRLEVLAQQSALDKERTRIARDLHDDLGGSLTQVKQLFELALRHRDSPDKMGDYLQKGLTKTQSGIKSLDETVWAVNPRNDSIPYLIDYIGQSTVEFLHLADIRCRADLPVNPPDRNVSAEARHNLFLVVKEALTNIVRHARASEVQLRASVTEESLTLTINDNGQGFEHLPTAPDADGLRNMRQRMEEIGGKFSIESKPGAGTSITMIYFWPTAKT